MQHVVRALGLSTLNTWSTEERNALELLAPSICMITDLADWPRKEKVSLIKMIRAKAERTEDRYFKRLKAHGLLLRSWHRILHA